MSVIAWLGLRGSRIALFLPSRRILSCVLPTATAAIIPIIAVTSAAFPLLAAIAAAIVLGGVVSYYLLFAMVAWLFALLVYYTVKMM